MANNTNCYGITNGGCKIPAENKLSLVVRECIKHIVEKENFISYHLDVKDISTNGGNYLGVLQSVDIIGKKDEGDKEINLFVKNIIPSTENFYFSIDDMFWTESFMYKEVLQRYSKLQEEYGVPVKERYNVVKSYCEPNTEAIVLENMAKLGYGTVDRREVLSLKFAEISVSQLAKFHALSFVLQQKQPVFFEKNVKNLELLLNMESSWESLMKIGYNLAVEALEGENKIKFENFYPDFIDIYLKNFSIAREKGICLCHGDYRPNNILMRKDNGEVSDVYVVDYQFLKQGSPVIDLIYFIFLGSDQEFRNANLEHLKDYYYSSFEKFLKYFDIKSEDVYPRKRFEKEFRDKLIYGLVLFVILIPALFTSDEDVVSTLTEIENSRCKMDEDYKFRVREIVNYFVQEGLL